MRYTIAGTRDVTEFDLRRNASSQTAWILEISPCLNEPRCPTKCDAANRNFDSRLWSCYTAIPGPITEISLADSAAFFACPPRGRYPSTTESSPDCRPRQLEVAPSERAIHGAGSDNHPFQAQEARPPATFLRYGQPGRQSPNRAAFGVN